MPCLQCHPKGRPPFRADLLHSEDVDPDEVGPQRLFPKINDNDWLEWVFYLCWTQHGGSGLGMSPFEVPNLDLDELLWFVSRVTLQRETEAEELAKALRKS